MRKLSSKAQSELISKITILMIMLALSGFAYKWGSDMMEAQGVRTEAEGMTPKLLELRSKIVEVANAGNSSARFIDISLNHGTFTITPGEACTGTDLANNTIIYKVSARDFLVQADSWSLADSENRNMLCNTWYENSSSGVIINRKFNSTDSKESQYALWFRHLNDTDSGRIYLINLTTGGRNEPLQFSEGNHQLRIESGGTYEVGDYVYTRVMVSEV
jgi:hypothetical protein|tara:strand:- start:26 stop:679 length:654 start_codon:yes stop_codon:yes gene_type:complete